MTPEQLNRLAMWGTIGILVVAAAVFGVRRAGGDPTADTVAPPIPAISALDPASIEAVAATTPATTPTTAGTSEQAAPTTVTLSAMSDLVRSGAPESSTTTSAAPSTTGGVSTTVPTATTTAPATTTTVPTTTTTVPTTTTTAPATTTTVPTTTTTAPATTTTVPTTITTVPATTTTVPAPGLFVIGFDGQAEGDDDDDWSVLLSVNLGSTVSGTWRAQVYVSWSGAGSGRTVLETGGSGKASAVVGPFDGDSVVFTIEDIRSSGWVYLPGLNLAATRFSVAAPAD